MLRSNFPVGTTRWAVRRAQWRALGVPLDEMDNPKIAVVNSSSSLSSCYSHLDELSALVQVGIREAGGLPFEIHTVAPSDFVTSAGREGRYLMPTRDLLVNDIEVMVEGALLDGMVCLSSCDKTTPAHLMAAGRLDIPTILVIGGYQDAGLCQSRTVDIDDVYESVGAVAAGRIGTQELAELADCAIAGAGVCAGLGTANTMHMVAEALGMTLAGSAPIRATGARVRELAHAAGARAVGLVREDLRPREIINAESIRNAVAMCVAVGGSVNAVRHLSAIASEAEIPIDVVACFEEVGARLPLLAAIRPNGKHRVPDLEAAGGARAVLYQLRDEIDLEARTVTGAMLGENLTKVTIDSAVVHPMSAPVNERGGLVIIRGSLAPDGAIVKTAGLRDTDVVHKGPARVFHSEVEAITALGDGRITRGDVVVLPGFGPRGGPGTVFAAGFAAALVGAGLADEVALVTDGELSGLNRGIVVGQVMPEAAEGGPLARVVDGDDVVINLQERRIDLLVAPGELASRPVAVAGALPRGWLGLYASLVEPIAQGAVLRPRRPKPPDSRC